MIENEITSLAKSVESLTYMYTKDRERRDESYELTIKLDSIEELQRLVKYKDAYSFIDKFYQYLRWQWKHADTPDTLDVIYKNYCHHIVDYGIDFD